jgi:hypothetical protein
VEKPLPTHKSGASARVTRTQEVHPAAAQRSAASKPARGKLTSPLHLSRAMTTRRRLLAATGLAPLAPLLSACGRDTPENSTMAPAVPVAADQLRAVAQRRVFFGHQSVGGNVMAGIGDLATPDSGLRVVESLDPATYARPVFGHALIGHNEQPLTKIDGFADAVTNRLQGAVDVAFFKFCYIDFKPDTDVIALFTRYREAMAQLQQRWPQISFAHVTTPLTVSPSAVKLRVKGLIGRADDGAATNVQRERFNDLLRKAYGATVFDLAHWESVSEAGERETFRYEGTDHASLIRAYSDDGAHLNPRGRRWVAGKLLGFVGQLKTPTALA